MQIAYIGNFEPRHSTETHVRLSLEALGHDVLRIQENHTDPHQLRMFLDCNQVDMVLYTRTWGLHGPSMLQLWRDLKSRGIPTVSYHLDLYRGLARTDLYERLAPLEITSPADDPFWQTEYCCTVDGDPESEQWFRDHGINHHWVRAGVYHAECYRVDTEPLYPVVFVGSYGYHPEWPYRPQLIDELAATYGRDFYRFGPPERTVRNHALNTVYGQSLVCVGDTLCPSYTHRKYWSDRVYETLGRGGFLIHPWIDGMELEFSDCEHLVYYQYGDFKGLHEKIQYYLSAHDEREAIRAAGHQKVKAECTYLQRMQEILEIVFS